MSGRRQPLRNFKGPWFTSYTTAQHDPEKKVYQWMPHSSTRQQLRNLRQKCRPILDSHDPDIKAMGARILAAVQGEPNPEFGMLHLIAAAMDAADDTGETWLTAMTYMLDKFMEMEQRDGSPHDT